MEIIRSIKHEKVSQIIELIDFANREQSSYIPVYGSEALEWAVNSKLKIDSIFISQSVNIPAFINDISFADKYYITEFLNKKITNVSHIIDICALACKRENEIDNAIKNKENIIVLDRVLDHGNIGTIIRTMRCFGYNNIIFTNYNMDVYYKNIVNSSRGEAFKIRHQNIKMDQMVQILKDNNYKIISTASDYSLNINDLKEKIDNHYAIIFGNETNGIDQKLIDLSDLIIGCPMNNGIDSLNVGVAAGIILNRMSIYSK